MTFPKQGSIPNQRGKGGVVCGRRGLPREWVLQMYADYQRLGSLEKVGKLHDRTRQNMFGIFQTHRLPLNAKKFLPARQVDGRKFTRQKTGGKHRYWRATIRKKKTEYLHHAVWIQHHGPIPPGFKVCFKDGNADNCRIGNLELLSNSEQVRKYAAKGENGATKAAAANLALLLSGKGKGIAQLRHAA